MTMPPRTGRERRYCTGFSGVRNYPQDTGTRPNHQTTILDATRECLQPLDLASWLNTVVGNSSEHAIFLGAKEQVAARLIAYRLPESVVNARRRIAKKKAKKKGYTPSKTHLQLLSWNLFITNVPCTIWHTETVG